MAFQPIVTLDTGGRIIGAEALARFPGSRHKTPDLWFAEAAAVGMGAALEVAAIRAALAELERFPPDAYMSVDVSPEGITSRELCPTLDRSASWSGGARADRAQVRAQLRGPRPSSDGAQESRSTHSRRRRGRWLRQPSVHTEPETRNH
ncbi:MAG: EAL domain-containing protein [Nocardioidaceae bacterium]|nr:EAL domain-containing protein [Nocardioidaceae bacterium]